MLLYWSNTLSVDPMLTYVMLAIKIAATVSAAAERKYRC